MYVSKYHKKIIRRPTYKGIVYIGASGKIWPSNLRQTKLMWLPETDHITWTLWCTNDSWAKVFFHIFLSHIIRFWMKNSNWFCNWRTIEMIRWNKYLSVPQCPTSVVPTDQKRTVDFWAALHFYSIGNYVTSWLKWLQIISNDSKWLYLTY